MKTMKEHNEHCKRIAEKFEDWALGNVYKCPHCEEQFTDDREYIEDTTRITYKADENHDESGAMRCPCCGEWLQFDDYTEDNYAEQSSMYDYVSDVYDVKVTRQGFGSNGDIVGVKICIAFGGPNIYIDTNDCLVKLHWWNEYGEWPISDEAAEALDDLAREMSYC